jgi:hypothetical protein
MMRDFDADTAYVTLMYMDGCRERRKRLDGDDETSWWRRR